mgnify:FL=1
MASSFFVLKLVKVHRSSDLVEKSSAVPAGAQPLTQQWKRITVIVGIQTILHAIRMEGNAMLDSQLHFLFMRCYHNTAKRITQNLQGMGLLSGQPKILECLLEQDGRTPKELGNRCALDKSTITSLLGKMEQQGLIRREVQPMDKRSVRIYLTQEGLEKGVQVQRVCSEVDASIVEGLSAQEQETLISSLRTILETLEGRTHA